MAVLKWKNVSEWVTLYATSIKNRLRRDLNLSDLDNKTEALTNLGLIGDISSTVDVSQVTETHCHDIRYKKMIDDACNIVTAKLEALGIKISGDAASTVNYGVNNVVSIPVSNITAEKLRIKSSTSKGFLLLSSGVNEQYVTASNSYADGTGKIYTTDLNVSHLLTGSDVRATSITGTRVYGAVWNDYAEYFPKGDNVIEPGDVVQLDLDAENEQYKKLGANSSGVVGVCSNEYSHIIGGENPPENEDFAEYNNKKYVAVALAGRVHVNIIGAAKKGKYVVPAHDGCVRIYEKEKDDPSDILGMLVEDDNLTKKRKLKIKIK